MRMYETHMQKDLFYMMPGEAARLLLKGVICVMVIYHHSIFYMRYTYIYKYIKIYRTSLKCFTATSLAPTDTEAIHPCMQDPSPNRLSPSDISSPLFFRSYQDTAL